MKVFDNEFYIEEQKKAILEVARKYGKLYFELGGKLLDDYHAARVLPGFAPDTKIQILSGLKNEMEFIFGINSENIQNGRIRSDYNTLYVEDCIRLIQNYREMGFLVSGIALTVFKQQPKALEFAERLKRKGEKVYFLKYIPEYPNNFEKILKAFEESDYMETTKKIVVITSSGSASGKLSACLGQCYKEFQKGNRVGYAKYDIFPVWNLPVNHPVNLAFAAATADSKDEILEDTYYYEKYHKKVSNYNRDLKVFPVIKRILDMCTISYYDSPTEMVINTMANSIVDRKTVEQKGKEEVCRRYFTYQKQFLRGQSDKAPILRVENIMKENDIKVSDLKVVTEAKRYFKLGRKTLVVALEDEKLLSVNENDFLAIDANLLVTVLGKKEEIEEYAKLQQKKLHIPDILKFFSKEEYEKAKEMLNGKDAHASCVLSFEEEKYIKSLGVLYTCEPKLES